MARINDPLRENVSTIADGDLLPIVDITDATLDKNITMAQIKAFSATDITGKQNLITTPVNNDVVLTDVTGQTKDSGVQFSAVTQAGNTFNGVNQLVQLNASGQLPAVDASLVTGLYDDSTLFAINSGYANATGNADLLNGIGATTLTFKVDNNVSYKPLKTTYSNKTQEVLISLASITGMSTDGSYTVLKEKGQNPVAVLSSTVTQGNTFEVSPTNGDYHCLTATGLQTYKRIAGAWVETQYVPLGGCVVSGGVITSVSTNTYNQNEYNVNVQSFNPKSSLTQSILASESPNYSNPISLACNVNVPITVNGWVIVQFYNYGATFLINGVKHLGDNLNGGFYDSNCASYRVGPGDYIWSNATVIFHPCKGEG